MSAQNAVENMLRLKSAKTAKFLTVVLNAAACDLKHGLNSFARVQLQGKWSFVLE